MYSGCAQSEIPIQILFWTKNISWQAKVYLEARAAWPGEHKLRICILSHPKVPLRTLQRSRAWRLKAWSKLEVSSCARRAYSLYFTQIHSTFQLETFIWPSDLVCCISAIVMNVKVTRFKHGTSYSQMEWLHLVTKTETLNTIHRKYWPACQNENRQMWLRLVRDHVSYDNY